MAKLKDLGWQSFFKEAYQPYKKQYANPEHYQLGRVSRDDKIYYHVMTIDEDNEVLEITASLKGKSRKNSNPEQKPAVGDWVILDYETSNYNQTDAFIELVLPRHTILSRKATGNASIEQIIATNVDYVAVVTDPEADFNLKRLDRYFSLIEQSGAKAICLVNKIDLYENDKEGQEHLANIKQEILDYFPDASVDLHFTSAVKKQGVSILKSYLDKGATLALIGSSGVGKSTMTNQLLGQDWQWTNEVNDVTGKGKHTTSARDLILLPDGGLLVDNPGIREIHLWSPEDTLQESFQDLSQLSKQCKFSNCKHEKDHGCAINQSISAGELTAERYQSYLKLLEEVDALNQRKQQRERNVQRRNKRGKKVKARNLEDRIDLEREKKPDSDLFND